MESLFRKSKFASLDEMLFFVITLVWMEFLHILRYIGTFALAFVLVLIRRLAPNSILNSNYFENSVFFNNSSSTEYRSREKWNVLVDIGIQFLQLNRGEMLTRINQIRSLIDNRSLPIDKKRIRVEKVSFQTSYGTIIDGEFIIPSEENNSKNIILYFHGGAFCICSVNTHRHLVAKIAVSSKTRVFLFNYRRCPEFVYPCQIEDGIESFHFLQSKNGGNYKPKDIIFAGDSAGGNLAVSVPLHLKETNQPLPGGIVVISPWLDLSTNSSTWTTNYSTDYLPSADLMANFYKNYVPNHMDVMDGRISPIHADLSGLPPVLVQVSSSEQLFDDSIKFESKAKEDGVHVTMDIYPGMPHVFQAFGGKVADEAIMKIGSWIQMSNTNSNELLALSKNRLSNISSLSR